MNWKADLNPMTLAAVEWLKATHPNNDYCDPGWVLSSHIEHEYPGGMDAFVADFNRLQPKEHKMSKFPDVHVNLTGRDGNGFVIAVTVRRALERAGYKKEAMEFFTEALSGDYDHLLQTAMAYVEVH